MVRLGTAWLGPVGQGLQSSGLRILASVFSGAKKHRRAELGMAGLG